METMRTLKRGREGGWLMTSRPTCQKARSSTSRSGRRPGPRSGGTREARRGDRRVVEAAERGETRPASELLEKLKKI